ncbi:MAG: MAPEG family protein [Proteobacteria bacterium]|nr:MAPEG family protein [Pseudomonadota bacterium]
MSIEAILTPLIVQVALTFAMLFWMGFARVRAIRDGEIRVRDVALGEPYWPPRVQQISNCFHNQLQLPVLFYVLVILAIGARKADFVFVTMAWMFVVTRLGHAVIHTTTNNVPRRFYAFLFGAVILLLMWVIFVARIFLAPVSE